MIFKKEKIYLGSFLRVYIGRLFKSEIKSFEHIKDDFSKEELNELKKGMELYRLVLLYFFVEDKRKFGKKEFSDFELQQIVSTAIGLASKDRGESDDDIDKLLGEYSKVTSWYLDEIEKTDKVQLKEKGKFFFVVLSFANLMKNNVNYVDEKDREKYFSFFDVGKQIYKNDKESFNAHLKQVKFLDN